VDALRGLAVDAADDVALCVADGEDHRGLDLLLFGAKLVVGRDPRRLIGLARRFLGLDALFLEGFEPILQVVGEGGAERRVVGGPEGGAPRADSRAFLHIAQSVPGREQNHVLIEGVFGDLPQRRVIVEDVEAAAEGTEGEVICFALDVDVAHLDGR